MVSEIYHKDWYTPFDLGSSCFPQHVADLIPPAFPAAVSGHRPLMKFESGYTVETVFDGSKLGIEPHSVEVTQSGELLLLDSVNSNLYRISLPLSRCELISLPDFLWGLIGFLSGPLHLY